MERDWLFDPGSRCYDCGQNLCVSDGSCSSYRRDADGRSRCQDHMQPLPPVRRIDWDTLTDSNGNAVDPATGQPILTED